jgi:hypothetical protein
VQCSSSRNSGAGPPVALASNVLDDSTMGGVTDRNCSRFAPSQKEPHPNLSPARVGEVWFWKRDAISVHALVDGQYETRMRSACLPDLALDLFAVWSMSIR